MTIHQPIIARGPAYAPYVEALRANAHALLALTQQIRDAEFEREAQLVLDVLEDALTDADALIADAEINCEPRACEQVVVGMGGAA